MAELFKIFVYDTGLTGNEPFDYKDIISDLSKVLGKLMKYQPEIGFLSNNNYDYKNNSDGIFHIILLSRGVEFPDDQIQNIENNQYIFKLYLDSISNEPEMLKKFKGFYIDIHNMETYWINIVNLAYEMKSAMLGSNETKKNNKPVFFTFIPEILNLSKDIIKSELSNYGFIDIQNYKDGVHQFDIKKMTADIYAFITIFPDQDSINENERNTITQQLKRIAEIKGELQHYIWLPLEEDQYKNIFFDRVKAEGFLERSEIIHGPLETFKSLLIKRLVVSEKLPENVNDLSTDLVYIVGDNSNLQNDLFKFLGNKGLSLLSSAEIIKRKNPVREHRDMLIKSNHIIIHYPEENPFWLMSKYNDIMKSKGYGRRDPFKSKILLKSESVSIRNDRIHNEMDVISYIPEKMEDVVETIIEKIK